MISNIPGNDIAKGTTLSQYLQPLPTEYAGTFRYIFYLLKQSKDVSKDFELDTFEKRKNFDLMKFMKENCETKYPSGITFFRTEYEIEVSLKYQEMNLAEPEYIPPDVLLQREKKSSKKVKLNRDRW